MSVVKVISREQAILVLSFMGDGFPHVLKEALEASHNMEDVMASIKNVPVPDGTCAAIVEDLDGVIVDFVHDKCRYILRVGWGYDLIQYDADVGVAPFIEGTAD